MKEDVKNHKKIKISHFFKGKRFFAFLAAVCLGLIIFLIISNIFFLGKKLNEAFNLTPNKSNSLKFDFEGFQKLKLIR